MPSAGSFTVGIGGDYSTWGNAAASVSSPLTGNLTFTQISDTIESVTINFNNINTGAYTLEITSNSPHQGSPSGGWACYMYTSVRFSLQNLVGFIDFHDLRVVTVDQNLSYHPIYVNTFSTGGNYLFRDVIIDTRSLIYNPNYYAFYSYITGGFVSLKLFNVKVIYIRTNSKAAFYLNTSNSSSTILAENCSAHCNPAANSGHGFQSYAGGPCVLRNCVTLGFDTAGGDGYNNATAGVVSYNLMSQDGTAVTPGGSAWGGSTNPIPNIVPANEFTSVDPTSGLSYLEPKSTGQAAHGGAQTYITENDHGAIKTIARPHKLSGIDKWSIGPNEYPSEPTITTQPETQRIDENDQATFSVVATDATGYQWQKRQAEETALFYDIIGANSADYITPSAGAVDHQTMYRCKVTNAAGEVTSSEVYLLINGLPDPGAGGSQSPDPPSVSLVSFEQLIVKLLIADQVDANVWYAQATDESGAIVDSVEIEEAGLVQLEFPNYNHTYVITVLAGATNSPPVWSLPGYAVPFEVGAAPTPPLPPRTPIEVDINEEAIYSDLDPDLRTDWQGNLLLVEDADALSAQLENSFGIEPGEMIMFPLFGSDLNKVIGRNVSVSASDFIRMVVQQTLNEQEQVEVLHAQIEARPNDKEYRIFIEFRERKSNIRGTFERFTGGERDI